MNVPVGKRFAPAELRVIRRRLLVWAETHGRSFPWRVVPDAYQTLISEILLRRTQAPTVAAFLPRFFARYPGIGELASSDEAELSCLLAPLGLRFQRSTQLQRVARIVKDEYDGRVPKRFGDLRRLPGVGAYTAAAVRLAAFGIPDAAVDGNISRVVVRLTGLIPTRSEARKSPELWDIAREIVGRSRRTAPRINWALLDVAALHCKSVSPDCSSCPLESFCEYASIQK